MSKMPTKNGTPRTPNGRKIVYVSGADIPCAPKWTKHINNLVERGHMEKAMNAARDMMNLGIEPSVVTFNTLIKGWCKIGKMSVAMHVTKVMLKMDIYPDRITYQTLIEGYCKQHDMMTAKRLVQSMIKVNLIPNIITFNQIIKALCDMCFVGDATILVDTLLKSNTKPDVITFTILLRGWCDVGDMKIRTQMFSARCPEVRHATYLRMSLSSSSCQAKEVDAYRKDRT